MLTVALTGGIGSGKTAVTELFQQLNTDNSLKIIDSDVIARALLAGILEEKSSTALQAVHQLFGPDVFEYKEGVGTQLNREKMRNLVFSSEAHKKQLEDLLHPLVYQEIFSQINHFKSERPTVKLVIIAIPLLFETGYKKEFDRVLVVDVPKEMQIKRSLQRDQCSYELIEKIINSQVDRQTRLQHADDIIDNSGSRAQLQKQVDELYQYYRSLS